MGLTPAARITLPPDWHGTAEELAVKANEYLEACGFDAKFGGSERLVRYYVTRGALTAPDKDDIDRRKAVFGPLQFRQLILTRLLAERGWDIDRIVDQFQTLNGPKGERELDALLNQLAEPTQAEKLLFKSRRDRPDSSVEDEKPSYASPSVNELEEFRSGKHFHVTHSSQMADTRESLTRRILKSVRGEEAGLDRLAQTAEKLLKEASLAPAEAEALKEIAVMARLAFRQDGKKERWTRVKLAPWCEVNIRVGSDSQLSESQKAHIIREFKQLIEDYDSTL